MAMAERAGRREPVLVREVGPRDGLQMVRSFLPTERKIAWLHAAAAAGIREIEVTSFVPPHVLAQFADAEAVAAAALAVPGLSPSALVVNLKGALRAFDSGLARIGYVVSASEAHSLANVRRTRREAMETFREIVAERDARGLTGQVILGCGIATAFGCTLQGEVDEADVVAMATELRQIGADELLVADTVGYADPAAVRRVFANVIAAVGDTPLYAHFHDTRGLGLANVVAALDAGVRRFDASLGGLGGCPFAPGATGNVNLEDCVYMLEAMGLDTGIDLGRLLDLRRQLAAWLPDEALTGAVHRAGLPKHFAGRTP